MLLDDITQEIHKSQIAKDMVRVNTLRLLLSEANNRAIELRPQGKTLSNEDVLEVIVKEAKKHKDSIEAYENAKRTDLVNEEKAELKIIEEYLPKQMSEDEVEKIVSETIAGMGATPDFGTVMREVMSKLKGQADGKVVSEMVKKALS